jgi:thiamine transport system permease protein
VLRQGFEAVVPTDFLFAPYGLAMVVLAHMFFNAPLVMRVCFAGLQSVPKSQLRLAAQLGFTARDYWKWIELPCIKSYTPSLFGLIFLMCFSSFSLVLMLGGGPSVSTLEVAIYTAVRFEFDLPKAGVLALMQLGFSALMIISLSRFEHLSWTTRLADQASVPRKDKDIFTCKLSDGFFIFLFCLIVIAPIASLFLGIDIVAGLPLFQRPVFWQALQMSAVLGVSSAILSTSMALILVAARYNANQLSFSRFISGFLSLAMSVYLVLPSIVLGTASFMLLRAYIDVFSAAFWLVLMSNVFMTLPFATRILAGRYAGLAGQTDRLALALNLRGLRRFRLVVLPAMRHEIGLALGLCCAFSLGDFGVIALFGSEQFRTLPWLLYQYASRYGGAEAELLSLILLVLSIALYAGLYQMVRLYSRRVTGC